MTIASNYRRAAHEHFEPGDDLDPQAQRRLRGHLEQIDYTAYAANREVVGAMLGTTDAQKFQKLGVAAGALPPRRDGATELPRFILFTPSRLAVRQHPLG